MAKWEDTANAPRDGTWCTMRKWGVIEFEARWRHGRWEDATHRKEFPTEYLNKSRTD